MLRISILLLNVLIILSFSSQITWPIDFHNPILLQDKSLRFKEIVKLIDRIEVISHKDLPNAAELSEVVFDRLKQYPNDDQLARLHNIIAYQKIMTTHFNISLEHILLARKIANEIGNKREEIQGYRLESLILSKLGEYDNSLSLLDQAMKLHENSLSFETFRTLHYIGLTYYEMDAYERLLEQGFLLLNHSVTTPDSIHQAHAFHLIGEAYLKLNKTEEARGYIHQANRIFAGNNISFTIGTQLSLAEIEFLSGNYIEALEIISDSSVLSEKFKYTVNAENGYLLEAKVHKAMGDIEKAKESLNQLLEYASENNNKKAARDAYEQLAIIYEGEGDYEAAYDAHLKFKEHTDSLTKANDATKIAMVETRMDMAQKENEISLLKAESELHRVEDEQAALNDEVQNLITVFVIILSCGLVFVLYRSNVARRKLAQSSDALKIAYRHAEDANKSKSMFLASMSHDLRTPLNAIIGFSDIMKQEVFGKVGHAKYKEYNEDIMKSGKLLLSLIDDVLDLSKVEAGKYELTEEELSLKDIVETSVTMNGPIAKVKNITIDCKYSDNLPKVRADDRVVLQILNNLVSNSLKFMDDGGLLAIELWQQGDGGLSVSVSDDGIGMTAAEVKMALKPFEQVENELEVSIKGTGLGLSLCVRFMDIHGGSLELTSEKNVGTTATIHFPASRTINI